MFMIMIQPDLMKDVFIAQMLVRHMTMYSLMSDRVCRLFSMIRSNGFRKSF